jgi:DNA polymerase-1
MTDPGIPKIGHNLKYDFLMLAKYGLRPHPLGFDTMLAEWLCNPSSRNLGLKNLAWVRLGTEMTQIEDLIGRGSKQKSMADVPVEQAAPYAAADAEVCLRLMPLLSEELEAKQQTKLFNEIEMPLVTILADMEMAGIAIDQDFLAELSAQLDTRLTEIEDEIFEQVGHPFNINSTQQLSTVLFDELGLTPPDRARRTASGHFSTAAAVLEELRQAHPVIGMILQQREISKLRSTYTDALVEQINPGTKRIHTAFSQTGSVTGRLASSNPNLQNIPIRTELGREIRRAFVAGPDQVLLSVDYSQIELRIVAHMSGDEAMIQAFMDDQDIHAATASAVFGVDPDAVSPEMRRNAKAINFGLMYGMSAFGLTRTTDLTLAEAEDFVERYFEQFPGVRAYLQGIREAAVENGYVETILGRRRYFPELAKGGQSVAANIRQRAEREAINAPIQGSAADIIKIAMLKLPAELERGQLMARLLLQVHDELLLECPEEQLGETAEIVQSVMQDAYSLRVPIKTDAKAGANWAALQPL